MKLYFFLLFGFCITQSCIECVDDRPGNIALVETESSAIFVYSYYDSVPKSSWNHPKKEWVNQFNICNDTQIRKVAYYFPPPHEEMYYLGFSWPIVIQQVYNESSKTWLSGDKVSPEEAGRIKKRFETEVILPMVEYAKAKNLSSKIIYGK